MLQSSVVMSENIDLPGAFSVTSTAPGGVSESLPLGGRFYTGWPTVAPKRAV